ncbi:hypothetical protein CPB84DRAFT_1784727 [Gymnopilus junonius]|uniref:Acetyl-CoA synthetase-like protein n=1 Tax=Gymnopilus junonius TaxID=109634 RepID=A0A9P5TLB5_GYMJU|nr:hypothetical protein CPB84DRAFT_1784727 [Gymnopilus junonius]
MMDVDMDDIIPPLPKTQALSSKTFTIPPLDGSLTLPEIFEWHEEHSKDHRLFVFAQENGEISNILWPEVARAVRVGARHIRQIMGWKAGIKDIPVVAILAASDTFSYLTTFIAILRAGYIAFAISPRNSPAAVAHLLYKVGVNHLLVGHEASMIELSNESLELLSSNYPEAAQPKRTPIPLFEDLYLEADDDPNDIPFEKRDLNDVVVYMHSSGSTNFPKPIPWTNRRLIELGIQPFFGGRDLTGVVFSWHSVPMYHGMGIMQACWSAACGHVGSSFKPKSPAQFPTPQLHFESAVATKSDVVFSVPVVVEAWSRKPEYVKWLATRSGLLFGGGPLSKEVGDYLVSQGVTIFVGYGLTEGGIPSPMLPAKVDKDWEYMTFTENVAVEMLPQEAGLYGLVLVSSPFNRPSIINTKINGVDAYATSDLFIQHPHKPGYWRVYGRNDDQIMHSTGEKTNPGPLEAILNQDPHIQASVMFGRGQFQAGVIIDPKPQFKFDPSDQDKLAEFRNNIWPTVQRMNEFAPQHSRLFKEMITVSVPSKPFQYTVKNTPRRQIIIDAYANEIKSLYDAVADSTQSSIPPPTEWELMATIDFVRLVVTKVMNHGVQDDEDIFQRGCDSLQATWIRNSLLRALHDSADIDTRHLVDNFVYDHPTVSSMGTFIYALATGTGSDTPVSTERRAAAMKAVVEKYTSSGFPSYRGVSVANGNGHVHGDVVLVTGTTGALGTYLLAELVQNPDVSRIYALNRPSASSALDITERQKKALLGRGLKPSAVQGSNKVRLIEADLAIPGFGIASQLYEEMKVSVTHIIHNAWPVDFNLALASFEKSIKGLRNLIDLSLSSQHFPPPTLVFTSSIGVFQNTVSISSPSLPESAIPPEVAVGSGYTESKWVSEEILLRASKQTPMRTVIVRVGQLCGGLNGAWNTSEWFPSLVQSTSVCKCFPGDERIVDWIPLQLAAKAVIDFRKSDGPESTAIVHLVHPRPTSWSCLSKVITADFGVEVVPFAAWLARLEDVGKSSNNDEDDIEVEAMRNIPALRLLPFFRAVSTHAKGSITGLGFRQLDSKVAVRLSKTLADPNVPQVGENDVTAWLGYWKNIGFISV